MPEEEKVGLPADAQPEVKPPETTQDVLPDQDPEKIDVAKLKEDAATVAREKQELADKLQKAEEEKATLEKRVRDNQEYISRTRNIEKVEKPAKTFDEYEKEVLAEFESDPKAGLKRVLRDVAYDRDLERRETEKRIKEAEENAFKRVLALDPEKGQTLKQVQALDEDRPDLANLTFDQKLEFVKLLSTKVTPKIDTHGRVLRDQEIAADVGSSRNNGRSERTASWANDPQVLREAAGHFKSKQEMLDWADPEKARRMGMQMRPQS